MTRLNTLLSKIAVAMIVVVMAGCSSSSSTSYNSSKKTSYKVNSSSTSGTSKKSSSSSTSSSSSSSSSKSSTNASDKKYGTESIEAVKGATQSGQASYYSDKLNGNTTASGEKYNKNAYTCAHRTLPFGTVVRITRTDTGDSVECTVNDRGPFKTGRIVDVSGVAAKKLDMLTAGVVSVKIQVVSVP